MILKQLRPVRVNLEFGMTFLLCCFSTLQQKGNDSYIRSISTCYDHRLSEIKRGCLKCLCYGSFHVEMVRQIQPFEMSTKESLNDE